uniref:Uncharacterized protein n=1 Tax=Arundo donax TaxID=35708 RepID=A0A0A9CJ51_ARUDO
MKMESRRWKIVECFTSFCSFVNYPYQSWFILLGSSRG